MDPQLALLSTLQILNYKRPSRVNDYPRVCYLVASQLQEHNLLLVGEASHSRLCLASPRVQILHHAVPVVGETALVY